MDAGRPAPAKRVQIPSPEWDTTSSAIRRAMRLTAELNKLSFDDAAKVRDIFSELTGRKVDDTFILIPPFYTAYGLDIRVGHKVFINQCCTLYDMGGVDIADHVMIGPNVNIITTIIPSSRPSDGLTSRESRSSLKRTFGLQPVPPSLAALSWAKTRWSQPERSSPKTFRRTAWWRVCPRRLFVRSRKTRAQRWSDFLSGSGRDDGLP